MLAALAELAIGVGDRAISHPDSLLFSSIELSVSYGFGLEPYALLPEGAKFYERLQEIGATK